MFYILFVLAFLAQTTVSCDVCGAPEFAPTLVDPKIYVSDYEYWYCDELVWRANEFDSTTCGIVQAYAFANCGCQDFNRNPPPAPVVDLSVMCNICGGPNGSNLHHIDPSMWYYNVGSGSLGITATCGFFYETALQGAFQGSSCSALQESTRASCWCGGPGW